MRVETKKIREGGMADAIVWVCDYRQPDLSKKPIRHVKPTKVIVRSNDELPKNKTVYYSKNHFAAINKHGKVTSKIISPVDNTGFRSRSGDEINVFDSESDCNRCYKAQCEVIIGRFQDEIKHAVENLRSRQLEVITNKNSIN